jgi:hypothetical protein
LEAIILIAVYGSRLDRNELPHKGLLPCGGEAIGFFMLSQEDVLRFVALYENDEPTYRPVLWETRFTEFARNTSSHPGMLWKKDVLK